MKAIIFRAINQLPKIEEIEIEKGECNVQLNSAAFNHRDLWITLGMYPGLRAGSVMGSDGMGIFEGKRVLINPSVEWGSNESFQSRNYRVLGVPDNGTFADMIAVNKSQIFNVPSHLSDEEAAALPIAGVTAYRALIKKCNVQKGENVLITGIGGGVALTAALMAQAAGANVFFTSGDDSKIAHAMKLGFSAGANYKNENWVNTILEASKGIDVVIDSAAGDGFASIIKLCNYGARISFYGGTSGKINNVNPQPIFWKQMSIFGSTMGSDLDFGNMLDFVSNHKIKPVIHDILNFKDFKKGFQMMESSSQFGKIVLKIN